MRLCIVVSSHFERSVKTMTSLPIMIDSVISTDPKVAHTKSHSLVN